MSQECVPSGSTYTEKHTNTDFLCLSLSHTHTNTASIWTVKARGLTTGKSTYSLRKSWDRNWVKSPKSAKNYKHRCSHLFTQKQWISFLHCNAQPLHYKLTVSLLLCLILFNWGGMMVQGLAPPHSEKVLGSQVSWELVTEGGEQVIY